MSLTLSFASHSDIDNRHLLLPNDHPIHPCWVPMEPSSPSQLDLELHRPPPGVAIFLRGCVLCRPPRTTGRSPTVPGSGRSHHDSDHHFHYIHKLRKFLPRFPCSTKQARSTASITFGCCLCDFVYQVSNLI